MLSPTDILSAVPQKVWWQGWAEILWLLCVGTNDELKTAKVLNQLNQCIGIIKFIESGTVPW